MQKKHQQWFDQWSRFKDDSIYLLKEWMYPITLEDFRGKRILDAGCGHGHHLLMVAPYIKEGIGVDLNTAEIASEETKHINNISIREGDIAHIDFPEPFDIVYCIGVIQHTDNPTKTFDNLKRLTKKGGTVIVWAYSHEGNFLNRTLLEGAKRLLINHLPGDLNLALAVLITLLLYPLVWSVYLLPLRPLLPFYDYLAIYRKLPFKKNVQNIFDKLIAPQTEFIKEDEVRKWFNPQEFDNIHISFYRGISWRCSGTKR